MEETNKDMNMEPGVIELDSSTLDPRLVEKIKEGMATPWDECIPESEVQW